MIVSEMLPELLFSVGGGMQDFSKEDLSLLSSSVVSNDKDPLVHTHLQQSHDHQAVHQTHLHSVGSGTTIGGLRVEDIKLTSIPDLLEPGDGNKLEESDRDLYPWHTGSNIGSRFLRSSDDPLISGGTNDNPHDNELSVSTVSQSMCPSPTTPPPKHHRHASVILSPELPEATLSPLPTPPKVSPPARHPPKEPQQPKRTSSAPRARRKGPLKLRFHHQALPQEYLDHYEATQNNLQRKEQTSSQGASKPSRQQTKSNQTGQSSKKAVMERQAALEREERTNESVRNWLQKILELQKEGVAMAPLKEEPVQPSQTPPSSVESGAGATQNGTPQKRIVSYTDLPYMGEITLDNSKPRRGRKPKKADICHLIYKNYGTILPGTPSRELGQEKGVSTKGCSRSVASLLERRLTSSDERKITLVADKTQGKASEGTTPTRGRRKEEPLNLCVRESGSGAVQTGGETFSVSSSEEDPDEVFASSCPTPIITPSDLCTDQALATNMKLSLPTLQSSSGSTTETPSTAETPPGYVYWTSTSNGGLFAHPTSMYSTHLSPTGEGLIGKLPEDHTTRHDVRTIAPSSNASSPAISPNGLKSNQTHPLLVPKHISQLLKSEKQYPPNAVGGQRSPPAQKRKRSAIFIPPVPAENSPNPATEVSICKFKFTGGAKPCLQEKKILSVDSGGNFRYYSGTGDKSMRGYEFFPRESLQQSSINATSTTGAFLNASGERISCDLPPPSLGLSNDLLQIPEFPTSPQPCASLPGDPTSPGPPCSGSQQFRLNSSASASERRRRKTRRATQRESLEKTFKEKGFLIQTQQLQSAEGATYCKFRQLRKFTRYLFRSWKDYLPGELQQQSVQQQDAHQLQDGELPSMILPTVITSGRDGVASSQEDHTIDEESLLASSTSSMRMETIDGGDHRSTPDRVVPTDTFHRLTRNRRISSTSVTSQHVHSESLVIDTTYHRHGSPSPVVD